MCSNLAKTMTVAGVGIVVITLASTLGWIWYPTFVDSQFVIKEENADVYDMWIESPVPISMQFFVFDCLNCLPDQLRNKTFKPVFKEHGPFSFREARLKFNVTEDRGLLTYTENTTFFYEPQPGEEPLNETWITSVNPIYFTIMALIDEADIDDTNKVALSTAAHNKLVELNELPFMTHTVGEMLFDGWSVESFAEWLENLLSSVIPDFKPPPFFDNPRFSYFFGNNNTNPGNYTIESGANSLDELAFIKAWKGSPTVPYWNDQYCNMINGSDGTLYPPEIPTTSRVYLFTPDICRSVYGTYEKDVTTMDVETHRFVIPQEVFNSALENPDNTCFCSSNPRICNTSGILDLRSCSDGAPVMLSAPHFYYCPPSVLDAVEGLHPVKEWHETHFDIEPRLSVLFAAAKRMQFSIDVRRYSVPPTLLNLPDIIFPVMWLNESAKITPDLASDVKGALGLFLGVEIGRWCLLGAGIVLVFAAIVMTIVYSSKAKKKNRIV